MRGVGGSTGGSFRIVNDQRGHLPMTIQAIYMTAMLRKRAPNLTARTHTIDQKQSFKKLLKSGRPCCKTDWNHSFWLCAVTIWAIRLRKIAAGFVGFFIPV